MKKLLLLSISLIGLSASAQLTCESPTLITSNGLMTAPQITGTYYAGECLALGDNPNPKAIWYAYTPSSNGEVTISSDLAQNDGVTKSNDTRLSIFTGTCSSLNCYASSDDISGTNYRTTLTFPVAAGTTYYIMWDSGWLSGGVPTDKGFDFQFTFTSITCMKPYTVYPAIALSTTSEGITWENAIGAPSKYEIDWSTDLQAAEGTGTIVSVDANTSETYTAYALTELPASGEIRYFVRSDCGFNKSAWTGPYYAYLAKTTPYSNNFDDENDPYDGFQPFGWSLSNQAGLPQSGTIVAFSQSSSTSATNKYLFSRAVSLQANETVTLTFYTRAFSTGSPSTLKVFANNMISTEGLIQLGADISVSGTTYTLQTRTFTATTAGVYYFIFNNATPQVTTPDYILLDTINMVSALGVNDYLTSQFTVYPNPAKSVVNFSNGLNALVNTIEVTDLNGRVVKSVNANATEGQINISDLASGIYLMRITTDQGLAVKKIVKE